MIVVADTGPLLALAKINALDLLSLLYQQVIAAPTVFTEAVTAGLAQNVPDAKLLNDAFTSGRLQVRAPSLASLPLPFSTHRGEDESIRLAIEMKTDWLLVDDLDARRAALANFATVGAATGVKGTLGMIAAAYQLKRLTQPQAIDLVNALKTRPDVWISSKLCDQVIHTLQTS